MGDEWHAIDEVIAEHEKIPERKLALDNARSEMAAIKRNGDWEIFIQNFAKAFVRII